MTDTYRITKTQIDVSGASQRVVQNGLTAEQVDAELARARDNHVRSGARAMVDTNLYLALTRTDSDGSFVSVAYAVEVE